MDVIIDMQGFTTEIFIPKEVSILSRDGSRLQHWVFKPPYSWKQLDLKYKSEAIWLYNNYHGLKWEQGNIPYDKIREILTETLKDVQKIFVKGDKKKEFLMTLQLSAEITNVPENYGSLRKEFQHKSCFFT